jgi:hypothetical protein
VAAWLDELNGLTLVYVMAVLNSFLSVLIAFGVDLSSDRRTAIVVFVNVSLVAVAHISHAVASKQQQPAPPTAEGGKP